MNFKRLMFFGDSFAREIPYKQYCWKTSLSKNLNNIPIEHWGQGGSSREVCYNHFLNYLKDDYIETDLCIFCWTDLERRSIVWENELRSVNTSSILEDVIAPIDFSKIMKKILYHDSFSKIGQSGKISEMAYFATNYLLQKHNVKNLQYFCFADPKIEESLEFNLVSYLQSFKDYDENNIHSKDSDHFSPIAAIDFSNKVYKDLEEKYV